MTGRDAGKMRNFKTAFATALLLLLPATPFGMYAAAANQAPIVAAGATVITPSNVNRVGTETATLSADFTDADAPGVAAFTVTFKVREPDNATEVILVNTLGDGQGGLTITDNTGGSYTASYTWDPGASQALGLYDLYFEVSDTLDTAIDDFANNPDELELIEQNAPVVIAGTMGADVSPVNRYGANSTVLSAAFSDTDDPGIGAFTVTLKVREPDNTTEVVLVNALGDGQGGLSVTSQGGGNYTASYTWDPGASQTLGLYDLYFDVSDGMDRAVDGYANNTDELEVNELLPPTAPTVAAGAARVSISPVNRQGSDATVLSARFHDDNIPAASSFLVTFKVREPDDATEVILVNALSDGTGGLTVTDLGGGDYEASYSWDPAVTQAIGFYDLYFEVDDNTGMAAAVDGYVDNADALLIEDVISNQPPAFTAGATAVSPVSIERGGAVTTAFSISFTDADQPPPAVFKVTFRSRAPYNQGVYTVADGLSDGVGGMSITGSAGSYTASIDWDPPADAPVGLYDLYAEVSDTLDATTDPFDNNADELTITNAGENARPVVAWDAVFANPAGVERVGANSTTLSATFYDADIPGTAAFNVTFKLREPDDISELVLAANAGNGQSGVTISDDGGGNYTASILWDPPDAQQTGFYDLYFSVREGVDSTADDFSNNLDELQVYDRLSNNAPTVIAGTTAALPSNVNTTGSEFTMLSASFSDADIPGSGSFTITFKVREPGGGEVIVANGAKHGEQGLRVVNEGGTNYRATVLWNPPGGSVMGSYDLYFSVDDNAGGSVVDDYAANLDELTLVSQVIAGDGYLLRRTHDASGCGGPNSACHNLQDHQGQDCLTCHTSHETTNIYLIKETISTPNSGDKPVVFKTLGIGDPYNDPDPVPGDPTSGVMADGSDGVFTGVCEVCHTSTNHHRNDGSQLPDSHNDALMCTDCHLHTEGFKGGESSGGMNCSCHSEIFTAMSTGTSYHHTLTTDAPDYGAASCLWCHVDHDIFRPDLNPGIGARGSNLRSEYGNTPVQGDATVLANSDYSSSGAGGVCISCHNANCLACHSIHVPAKSASPNAFNHEWIVKTEYDAATTTHNYGVPTTFSSDGSVFQANCVKCHNDNMTRSYQNSTNAFSLHDSPYDNILSALGIGVPNDPMEEDFCYECHDAGTNPNSGSNLDYYGVQAMSAAAMAVKTAFTYSSTHPITATRGVHNAGENASSMPRHVECADCHDPHGAIALDPPSPALKGALYGVDGININGTAVDAVTYSYEVCFKCHGDNHGSTAYVQRLWVNLNTRDEFQPTSQSYHPVAAAGTNPNSPSLIPPLTESSIITCEDCHSSDAGAADGPHGSQYTPILKMKYVLQDSTQESAANYALCYSCHDRNSILGNNSFRKHSKHIVGEDAACSVCHDSHGVGTTTNGDGTHLINFNTNSCRPSNSGRLEFIDNGNFKGRCYVKCHGKNHDPKSY